MDIKDLPGLTPCGTIEHEEYGQLLLYDMDPYVNTPEGWNLFVQCYPNNIKVFHTTRELHNENKQVVAI